MADKKGKTMKTMTLVFVTVAFSLAGCSSMNKDAQYHGKAYFGGKSIRTVVVRSEHVTAITTIDVPPGMELCIFSTREAISDLQTMPVTMNGDLSIRTKPTAEIKPGDLAPQFAESAYRLDIKDAIAVVDTVKK